MDSDKYNLPIYTLRIPFSRTYMVNDTELIPKLQKQWRTISFAAQGGDVGSLTGMSRTAVEIINEDFSSDECFSVSWPKAIMPTMAPGTDLNDITRVSTDSLVSCVEELRQMGQSGDHTVNCLWEWTRRTMTKATTEAVWGPMSPYRDSAVVEAWRLFETGFTTLSLLPLPQLLIPKLFRARETVAAAMIDYFQRGGHTRGSALIQKIFEHHNQFGLGIEDVGRGQLGLTFAVLGSSAPSALWLLYHIFSDQTVLTEVRSELNALVSNDQGDVGNHLVDLAQIRTSCPVLLSTFQETLRYRNSSPGIRKVLDDVMVDGWLLKKGSVLLIPNTVQHTSTLAWGDSAATFDHRRFLRGAEAGDGKTPLHRTAFRPFGGGHVLCPGRHFASTEILALTAMMILQFDIVPVNDAQWPKPTWVNTPVTSPVPIFDEDIVVEFRMRDPEKKWKFVFSGSSEALAPEKSST